MYIVDVDFPVVFGLSLQVATGRYTFLHTITVLGVLYDTVIKWFLTTWNADVVFAVMTQLKTVLKVCWLIFLKESGNEGKPKVAGIKKQKKTNIH